MIIYPTRATEQAEVAPFRALLESDQVHRGFLNEVGNIRQVPLGVALMLLTTLEETEAPEEARYLLARAQQAEEEQRRGIIEMITTIVVYKFGQMSRLEVEAMLGVRLEETCVYQEAKAEGEQIGEERGEQRGRREGEQRGRQDEAIALILRQLTRQLKQELPEAVRSQISSSAVATVRGAR